MYVTVDNTVIIFTGVPYPPKKYLVKIPSILIWSDDWSQNSLHLSMSMDYVTDF